jgi:hypothetical protein
LAKAILAGEIARTSMGTDVEHSICSVCNNRATTPAEYCAHIPRMKGQRIYRHTANGKKEGILVREICYGLKFFENSLLVEPPADPTAYFLGVDSRGLDKAASFNPGGDDIPLIKTDKKCEECGKPADHIHLPQHVQDEMRAASEAGQMHAEMHDSAQKRVVNTSDHHDLKSHLIEAHDYDDNDFYRTSHDEDHPALDHQGFDDEDRDLHPHEVKKLHDWEHGNGIKNDNPDYRGGEPGHFMGDSHFHTAKVSAETMARVAALFGQTPSLFQHFAADETPTGDDLRNHLANEHAIDPKLIHRYPAEYLHDMHHRDVKTEMPDYDSGRTNVLHTHSAKLGFGEIKAPAEVDTLRDEECPVCGETDSYDGAECKTCGFIAPPKMFQDPDLDVAKSMDLRQQENELQDLNAGMPEEVPGSEFSGTDDTTVDENGEVVDPAMVGDDGSIAGPQVADDQAVVDGEVRTLGDEPLDLTQIDEEGNILEPDFDPDAATGHVNQGGEPFTPGPNMPTGPGGPEGPEGPMEEADESPEAGYPGTPGDGVADLTCPSCGFSAPGSTPTSTNMNDPMAPVGQADGLLAGDVCPNCKRATLLSIGEINQQEQAVEQMQGLNPV